MFLSAKPPVDEEPAKGKAEVEFAAELVEDEEVEPNKLDDAVDEPNKDGAELAEDEAIPNRVEFALEADNGAPNSADPELGAGEAGVPNGVEEVEDPEDTADTENGELEIAVPNNNGELEAEADGAAEDRAEPNTGEAEAEAAGAAEPNIGEAEAEEAVVAPKGEEEAEAEPKRDA